MERSKARTSVWVVEGEGEGLVKVKEGLIGMRKDLTYHGVWGYDMLLGKISN